MAESLGVAVLDLTTDNAGLRSGLRAGEHETAASYSRMRGTVLRTMLGIATSFAALKLGHALFVTPIKMAGDFQKALNVLWATADHGKAKLSDVSKLAIKLGADIHLPAVSASDAANAMLLLGKAGFSVGQAMASVRGTLLLATAAETDAATAAKVVTQNINAFGLQAKDTNAIVDQMAGFMNATGTSFNAFTDSLTYAAGPAHAIGQSFKETATQLALLSQKGFEGSIAGTGLRQVLTRLALPTGKAHDAFKALGISTLDASGNFIGIRKVMELLQPKLDHMTQGDKAALWKEAFGQTAMNQARALLTTLPSHYDKVEKGIGRVGQAQRLANAMTSGFNGALSALVSTVETLGLTLGTKLLPYATRFARFLTDVAGAKSFTIAIKVIWSGIVSLGSDLLKSIEDMLFGAKSDVALHGHMRIGRENIVVDKGFIDKLKEGIDAFVSSTDWGSVGKKIGDGISKTIKVETKALDTMMSAMLTWVNSHSNQIANVGLVIGLTMIKNILDPSFWIAHWQLIGGVILAVASTVFTPAKFASLGARLAEAGFGLFGRTVGELVLKGLELLPGVVGRFAPKLVAAMGRMLADVTVIVIGWAGKLAVGFVDKVSGGFGKLGGIVKVLLYTGIVNIIGTTAVAAVKAAENLASDVAGAIKTIPAKLQGLAGDLVGKIGTVISQVAGEAYTLARQIGFRIADGVISGIGNLASRLGSTIKNAASGAVGWAGGLLKGSGDFMFTKHVIGEPMMQGIMDGIQGAQSRLNAVMYNTVHDGVTHGGQAIAGAGAQATAIFTRWADALGNQMKAAFDRAQAIIETKYATAQAKLDAWKAKLTPAEAQIAALQAQAAAAQVEQAVTVAHAALATLKTQFAADWAKLLADQAKNMAALKATLAVTTTDTAIAGHEFEKTLGAAASDPLAIGLLRARQALDTAKQMFAEGKISQADLFAAQDAMDAAALAAQNSTDASKLIQDYDTWQNLIKQQTDGQTAITAQEAADQEARKAMEDAFGANQQAAVETLQGALLARRDYYLGIEATNQRIHHDAMFEEMSGALKRRHDRVLLHLDNVQHAWDIHYKHLVEDAKANGKLLGDAFVNEINKMRDGPLTAAMNGIAGLIAKYLRLHSPAELGPLSTIDHWWDKFVPTLLKGFDGKLLTTTVAGALSPTLNPSLMGASIQGQSESMNGQPGSKVNLTQNFYQTPANADPVAIGAVASYSLETLRT